MWCCPRCESQLVTEHSVVVVRLDEDWRELWFQHSEPPGILRCVEVDLNTGEASKPVTFKTKGEREREYIPTVGTGRQCGAPQQRRPRRFSAEGRCHG